MLPIVVTGNNLDKAVRNLKRQLQKNGVNKELRKRAHHMKPSEKRQKKAAEAARRMRKNLQKRLMTRGY